MKIERMPQEELVVYGNALMAVYLKGGDHMVFGRQMTRREIVADLKAVGAELKERQERFESTQR